MGKQYLFNPLFYLSALLLFFVIMHMSPESGRPAMAAEQPAGAQTSEPKQADSHAARKPIVHPEVPRIPALEVKEMLARKADFVIVDTNPADFFDMWHIPTAVNIPYIKMMDNPESRRSMVSALPKDKLIVLYCLCEEGADSSEVALILRSMDFRRDNIKVLEGGMIKWDEAGYPMIKNEVPE
jgi:rhodanese-related sulfurtransferase